jgi:hypothetical protein
MCHITGTQKLFAAGMMSKGDVISLLQSREKVINIPKCHPSERKCVCLSPTTAGVVFLQNPWKVSPIHQKHCLRLGMWLR